MTGRRNWLASWHSIRGLVCSSSTPIAPARSTRQHRSRSSRAAARLHLAPRYSSGTPSTEARAAGLAAEGLDAFSHPMRAIVLRASKCYARAVQKPAIHGLHIAVSTGGERGINARKEYDD